MSRGNIQGAHFRKTEEVPLKWTVTKRAPVRNMTRDSHDATNVRIGKHDIRYNKSAPRAANYAINDFV
jgi:hypothetical protein